jgi:hypothetical protein
MDTLIKDRSDFIARHGEHVAAILVNPRTADYELFFMGHGLPTPEQTANYSTRGLTHHVGTFGVVLGEFLAHFTVEIPTAHAAALGRTYRQLTSGSHADNNLDWLRRKLAPKTDDSAGWLQALYELNDPREAN